jgi:hypothetical protein
MAAPGSFPDIDTCILFAVRDLLVQEMQTKVAEVDPEDPLLLKYICIGQLQEDFTRSKFSNAIALDFINPSNPPVGVGADKAWVKLEDPMLSQRDKVLVEIGKGGGQFEIVRIYLRSEVYLRKVADEDGVLAKATLETAAGARSTWHNRLQEALWSDPLFGGITNSTGSQHMVGGNWVVIEQYSMTEQGAKGTVILGDNMILAYPVRKTRTARVS